MSNILKRDSFSEKFGDKSWVELCEEEEEQKKEISRNDVEESGVIEEEECSAPPATPEKGVDASPSGKGVSDLSFASYAHVLRGTAPGDEEDESSVAPALDVKESPLKREPLTAASQGLCLHEDISLTSHLDVFHMTSPCKGGSRGATSNDLNQEKDGFPKKLEPVTEEENAADPVTPTRWRQTVTRNVEVLRTPKSEPRPSVQPLSANRRNNSTNSNKKRPFHTESPISAVPDDVLMPSPSKISRNGSVRLDRSPHLDNISRKRQRDWGSPLPRHKKDQEIETDPVILERRQKQIDYGKNTIGYERYVAEVAKHKRQKNHPRTPPRNVKYSRRAWDGLIKIWRKRLHYWDPPSEGGGDPELLEGDGDESEISSCDSMSQFSNSVPSTPRQDYKRWKGRGVSESEGGGTAEDEKDFIDDDDGCMPLADEVEDYINQASADN